MMIANFLSVAKIADPLPFLKLIRFKKSDNGVESFKLPIAFAALV